MPTQVAIAAQEGRPFLIGDWLVAPSLNRLSRDGATTQLELKAMDVLLCLVEHAGEVIPKHVLLDTVWQTEFVSDNTLQGRIAELRDTLGDNAQNPRYIETIRKRGYRLIAKVSTAPSSGGCEPAFPERSSLQEGEINPYPGLASFTEADTDLFFGRDVEVASLWRKITSRRLLAVIGPSGIGKSSLLRAGVAPRGPSGWRVLVFTPGEGPTLSLARALAPDHAGDPRAVAKLVGFTDPDTALAVVSRWRGHYHEVVLVIDQFEELFTLNTPDVQAGFIDLLRRLVDAADVHVVIAMRDDFLHHCQLFPQIAPIFKDLTPLGIPAGEALRRAIEEPAARMLYRFESEVLVDRMIAEVEGQHGALPLLAFAVNQLWQERDREQRVLTENAYERIGGVAGALAGHAEATIDRIGVDRLPVVRELFRNLVTAEGTRAVRDTGDLLSVFPPGSRHAAGEVLRELIDARLLTSYGVHENDSESTRHVEIIHESLLANWPRLVRWQTQDADAAQLRDQLRQAARTWHEHDRSRDLLWTGSAFREFASWRERYPGGLTEVEEAFGEAMARHAERRKRRRQAVVASTFVALASVLVIVGGFWRRAVTEGSRADAANLFSLGHLLLEEHPSATIAYAIASLERAENPEVRRLALEALWMGPTELRLQTASYMSLDFSPNGRWLATADRDSGGHLWPTNGGAPTKLEGCDVALEILFSPDGDHVAANIGTERRELGLWSVPEGRFLRSFTLGDEGTTWFFQFTRVGERLITSTQIVGGECTELVIRSWPVEGGAPDYLARLPVHPSSNYIDPSFDAIGSQLAWADGRTVHIAPLMGGTLELSSTTSIEHDRAVAGLVFDPQGLRLATRDTAKTIRVWSLGHDPPELTHAIGGGKEDNDSGLLFDPSGSVLLGLGDYWDLTAPPEAAPVRLRRSGYFAAGLAFEPKGDWVATSFSGSVSLWPLARTYPRVLRGHEDAILGIAFTPDGSRLVSTSRDGSVRVWPLGGRSCELSRVLDQVEGRDEIPWSPAMPPDGSFVAVGYQQGQVKILPLDGRPGRELSGFTDVVWGGAIAVGPEARLVAAGAGRFFAEEAIVRIWDLESGEVRIVDAGDGKVIDRLEFTRDGDLWVESGSMLRRWELAGDAPRLLEEHDLSSPGFVSDALCAFDPDSRRLLLWNDGRIWFQHLDTHEYREVGSHAHTRGMCSWDPATELVISTDKLGDIRVGTATGEEHHLLPGRKGGGVAVSPDGQWIASGGEDNTIRIWPMPDLDKPPLHTLPRDELINKLKTLTNLRVVRDEESSTGWKIEVGPFPGWEKAPTW